MACHHPPSLYFYPLRPFRTNLIFLCHDSLQIFDDSCHIRAVFSSPSGSTLVPVSSFHRTNTVNFCSLCSLTLFHIYLFDGQKEKSSPEPSHPRNLGQVPGSSSEEGKNFGIYRLGYKSQLCPFHVGWLWRGVESL